IVGFLLVCTDLFTETDLPYWGSSGLAHLTHSLVLNDDEISIRMLETRDVDDLNEEAAAVKTRLLVIEGVPQFKEIDEESSEEKGSDESDRAGIQLLHSEFGNLQYKNYVGLV